LANAAEGEAASVAGGLSALAGAVGAAAPSGRATGVCSPAGAADAARRGANARFSTAPSFATSKVAPDRQGNSTSEISIGLRGVAGEAGLIPRLITRRELQLAHRAFHAEQQAIVRMARNIDFVLV